MALHYIHPNLRSSLESAPLALPDLYQSLIRLRPQDLLYLHICHNINRNSDNSSKSSCTRANEDRPIQARTNEPHQIPKCTNGAHLANSLTPTLSLNFAVASCKAYAAPVSPLPNVPSALTSSNLL